jgi:hypothetical protein
MLNENKQRELAYIVVVDDVQPIEGYDRIRYATVNGWHCVVGLDINKGDECVYFEVDSLLDKTNPVFAFCEKYNYKVKTQKYCKGTRISQGLLMPLSSFPQLKNKQVGDFVTKELNITYYDPMDLKRKSDCPSKRNFNSFYKKLMKYKVFRNIAKTKVGNDILFFLFGIKKKKKVDYPWFIPKTDEERIQNCPWVLDGEDLVEVTEKVDGCSSSFGVERDKRGKLHFYVCSRNVVLTRDTSAYYDTNYWFEMYDKYNIEQFLTDYITKNDCDWVYLQGETYGDGVQKRNYSLKGERDFRAFILCDSNHDTRFTYEEVKETLEPYSIPTVPIFERRILPKTVDEVMELAKGKSEIDGLSREGLVFRSVKNPQISYKAVDAEFIMKYHG